MLNYLSFRTPTYLNYSQLNEKPQIMEVNDVTGLFQLRMSSDWPSFETHLIREKGSEEDYTLKLSQITNPDDSHLFNVREASDEFARFVKKDKFELGNW